mgnify:CR=1 FL=1
MKLLSKIISVLGLLGLTGLPLYAHNGSHPIGIIETLAHFFSSPVHLGLVAIVSVLILALVIVRVKAR